MKIVLDASIGVKWFSGKNEKNVDLALQIQEQKLKSSLEIIVPDLFFFEIMSALLKKKGFTGQIIHLALDTLYRMDLGLIYPDKEIIGSTIDISKRSKLTFYDSLYIAAAISRKAVLLTEDKEILSSKADYGFIKSLDEFY